MCQSKNSAELYQLFLINESRYDIDRGGVSCSLGRRGVLSNECNSYPSREFREENNKMIFEKIIEISEF